MQTAEALSYIRQALEFPSMLWISVTGGEPFLYPEALSAIVEFASKEGLHTECVINCFWAYSEDHAMKVLEPLARVGLDVLNISTDDFHQVQLTFEYVARAYRAARKLEIRPTIMCTVGRFSKLTAAAVIQRLNDAGIHLLGGKPPKTVPSALAVESGFLPLGRGAALDDRELLLGAAPVEGPCDLVLSDISITPEGNVMPCCAAASTIPGFAIGNASSTNLAVLLAMASERKDLHILSQRGPRGLQSQKEPFIEAQYVNRCHLCYEIVSRLLSLDT